MWTELSKKGKQFYSPSKVIEQGVGTGGRLSLVSCDSIFSNKTFIFAIGSHCVVQP
jgi:hypothetical protein